MSSRVFQMLYSGVATEIVEYAPQIRPMVIANAKSFSVSPPNSSMATTGTSCAIEVFMVRMITWLSERFAIVMNEHLPSSDFMFSLMRWNTTTLS